MTCNTTIETETECQGQWSQGKRFSLTRRWGAAGTRAHWAKAGNKTEECMDKVGGVAHCSVAGQENAGQRQEVDG